MSDLLTVKDLWIEGRSDETWNPIINGCSLTLKKGEVLGMIGESGAGKSTIGLACMGYTRDGVRISKGSVVFDGIDLVTASAAVKRNLLGKRIAYVAQSAAASFNPAHKIIDQHTEAPVQHGVRGRGESVEDGVELYRNCDSRIPKRSGFATRTKYPVANCSGR
jgi:peptide/nickel transport system ATP-binding protein